MLGNTLSLIRADTHRYRMSWKPKSQLRFLLTLVLLCPGFQLSLLLRIQREVGKVPVVGPLIRKILWYLATIYFSCDIDPAAEIGPGVYFPHPIGIVIGAECKIGANVAILHGVTLGRRGERPENHLLVEDGVEIGAGSKIFGEIIIGRNSKIGANAVVLNSVPANATAVGVPARVILEKTNLDEA